MHKVFVYGTLKKGQGLSRALDTSKFIREDETTDKMCMLNLHAYPGVVREPKLSTIKGELYEVDDETFKTLDHIEGYPRLYTRQEIKLRSNETAWIYIYNHKNGKVSYNAIENGIWE